jgi:hypothetical protein
VDFHALVSIPVFREHLELDDDRIRAPTLACLWTFFAPNMSSVVNSDSTVFTLIGFCGLYLVLGLLFVDREIIHGPEAAHD